MPQNLPLRQPGAGVSVGTGVGHDLGSKTGGRGRRRTCRTGARVAVSQRGASGQSGKSPPHYAGTHHAPWCRALVLGSAASLFLLVVPVDFRARIEGQNQCAGSPDRRRSRRPENRALAGPKMPPLSTSNTEVRSTALKVGAVILNPRFIAWKPELNRGESAEVDVGGELQILAAAARRTQLDTCGPPP